MSTDDDKLAAWRDKWLKTTANQSLLERRFRVSLTQADWPALAGWLSRMSASERKTLKWRYWEARIALETGDTARANKLFEAMVGERNFYSVAAATHLNKPIAFDYSTSALDVKALAPYKTSLRRISELLELDKLTAAKREWYHLLERVNSQEKAMLQRMRPRVTGTIWRYRRPFPASFGIIWNTASRWHTAGGLSFSAKSANCR